MKDFYLSLNLQFFGNDNPDDLAAQIKSGFAALKQAADKQEAEMKKFGEVTQETKAEIARINEELNELKRRLDETEVKANRGFQPGTKSGQSNMTPEQKTAFFKFVRQGKGGLSLEERKALVEDSTGQIIVPEELDREIYRELPKIVVMRDLATVRPIKSDRIRRRSMTEVTVGWGKLETSPTKKLSDFESSIDLAEEYQYVEDVYGLTKIGEDELEDTDENLQALLEDSFARAFAEAEAYAFLRGEGHAAQQPEGILTTSGIQRVDTAGIGALTIDDLIRLQYAAPTQYRRNGSFLMSGELEMMVRTMKNSQGDYIWQPSVQAGTPNTLLGRPVYTQDDFDAFAAGKDVAVFGDFKAGYRILDRSGGSLTRINELYIEDGLIGFKYKRRVGGGVIRKAALKVLRVKSS
ncbi:phage major capsid protein, HK97 family (plasmid) [Anoxybacillus sp. B7M1]|uniref:phage major capsid protein n=1 Tax=Anoxybacillus sp. B7M1 TaxID=1490057 RepID=UPI00069715C6|nr:phage major capsid protein [Anoxybacillus sp. B7M1]ANB66141.1 phage major capsid protein, HK97 family [Anoxybacillus sp. B7M1]